MEPLDPRPSGLIGTSDRSAPEAPQEKLTKIKSATSTSYYDFDTDFEIPFYGTQDPKEYLEWERNMDTYLKLLQVPSEDQVKCAARNFHD
ncbi:gag-pol polyprotein [Hordeum vulgare]|nr:gag-pol polyprotein [Hordeum vulgare]